MSAVPSHPSMLQRFEGTEGLVRLEDALKRQIIVGGETSIARDILKLASTTEFAPGTVVTTQEGADNDIYFIVSGSVEIWINGRRTAIGEAGTHFGDMALLDCTARRGATVRALESCVLVRLSENDFSEIAQVHPQLWRRIAVEMGKRLRARSALIRQPHNQPVLFIGSSSEALEVARQIQLGLSHDPVVSTVWTDGVFQASRTSIESLFTAVSEADFAALVLSPDDLTISREKETQSPRDNVLFELGLFMGGLSRERTFIVKQRGIDLKFPSDLFGVTPIEFAGGDSQNLQSRIAPVCTQLRQAMISAGPR